MLILNSHIVESYVLSTSDKRTFKIRIPVRIGAFDEKNRIHLRLAELSMEAHEKYDQISEVERIRTEIDMLSLKSLGCE